MLFQKPRMLNEDQIHEIARINALDAETTQGYLLLTGDNPAVDATGKVVVCNSEGTVLTRLQWPEDLK